MQKRKYKRPGKKAVVRAECLARLKGGATPVELLKEFSPGPVYDAVREFLVYSAGEVEEIRRSREKELQELARVKEEGKVAVECVATRKAEVESLAGRLRGLEEDVTGRGQQVAELRLVENRLDLKLEEYSGRGITDRTFGRLGRFSFGGEDELISRLDTAERYLSFVSETEKKGIEWSDLTGSLEVLGREKATLDADIVKLKGERDEERSKNFVQSESIRILSTFYDDGYASDDIEGIRIGLNTLGIRGNPETSVRRLVDFLRGELELSKLKGEIGARRDELEVLVMTIERVKGQLNSYRDVALAALTKSETTSRACIEGVYADTVGNVKAVGESAEKQIQNISSSHVAAIDAAGKKGIETLINIHSLAKLEIEDTVDSIRNEVKTTIRAEFEPYHRAFELVPMMQPFASYGFLLMRVPMDRTLAYKVPKIFVANMATSIDSWVKEMLPEAMTTAPKDVVMITPALGVELPCKLFAVSTWLRQELTNITRFS